jgi:hypothetical protein
MARSVQFQKRDNTMDLFRWLQLESFRRCSLATVRYVAQATRSVSVTYLVE